MSQSAAVVAAAEYGYEVHPVAEIFPLIDDEDLAKLADDIRKHGLIEPIVVAGDVILDGRNRLRACLEVGIEPEFREWEGAEEEIVAWILSKNLHRRHLTTSQRAAVAAALATLEHGQRQSRKFAGVPTQAQAAKMLGVSERSVQTARKVLESGDDKLIEAVKSGEVAVSAAAAQLKPQPASVDDIDGAVRTLAGLLQELGAVEQGKAVPAVMARRQLAQRLGVAKIKDHDWEEILDEGRVHTLWVCDAEVDGGPLVLWLLDQDDPARQGYLAALEDTDPDTDEDEWEDEDLEEEDPGEGPVLPAPDGRIEKVLYALEGMVRGHGGRMGLGNARACLWKLGPLTDEEWSAVLDLGARTSRVVRDDARGEVVCVPKEGSSNGRTSDVGSSPTPSPSVPSSAELGVTASVPGGVAEAQRPHGEEVARPPLATEKSGSTPGPGTRALPDNERAPLDAYWTPDRHASALARWLDERLFAGAAPKRVLEPSVGGGAWVRAARDLWPSAKVDGLDLDASAPGLAQVDGFTVCDFLEAELDEYDLVIGNPPYKTDLIEWVDRSREVGRVVAYLMRSTFAGSRKRARWFAERARPAHVVVVSPRPKWEGPGKRSQTDKVDSFFFVWTPGQPAETRMHFLELDDQGDEDLEDEEIEP